MERFLQPFAFFSFFFLSFLPSLFRLFSFRSIAITYRSIDRQSFFLLTLNIQLNFKFIKIKCLLLLVLIHTIIAYNLKNLFTFSYWWVCVCGGGGLRGVGYVDVGVFYQRLLGGRTCERTQKTLSILNSITYSWVVDLSDPCRGPRESTSGRERDRENERERVWERERKGDFHILHTTLFSCSNSSSCAAFGFAGRRLWISCFQFYIFFLYL